MDKFAFVETLRHFRLCGKRAYLLVDGDEVDPFERYDGGDQRRVHIVTS
jgi:hypothetical protein